MLGNVFSPGYFRARRDGPAEPTDFSTLNVALRTPRGSLWALTERDRRQVTRGASSLSIGASSVAWEGGDLVLRIDERCAPFGGPLRGVVRLRPRGEAGERVALDPEGLHRWWPAAPLAEVEVAMSEPRLRWKGGGYHDANEGDEGLERAFAGWSWSRAEVDGRAVVLYDTRGRGGALRQTSLRFDRDGHGEAVEVPRVRALPRGGWGVERSTRCDRDGDARLREGLLDAPFYTRSVLVTRLLGRDSVAVHESVDLERFAMPWVRLLLPFRMRKG